MIDPPRLLCHCRPPIINCAVQSISETLSARALYDSMLVLIRLRGTDTSSSMRVCQYRSTLLSGQPPVCLSLGRHPPRPICGVMRAACCWSLDDSCSTQIEVSHCPSPAFSTLS